MFSDQGPDGKPSVARHLAEMIALLGPPPLNFLQRSEKTLRFWDEQGELASLTLFDDLVVLNLRWRNLAGPGTHSARLQPGYGTKFRSRFIQGLVCTIPQKNSEMDSRRKAECARTVGGRVDAFP